jgi:hypothetical protein
VERQARLARRVGIDRVYLILSFDCDTHEDGSVAWDVHERLAALGVQPTYAVPGELLRRAGDTYRRIADTGAEFLNHGGVEHTYFDQRLGQYKSCFFYDQLDPDRVRQDVVEGDHLVQEALGVRPRGFRTPHFGTYGKPHQLRHLHRTLASLDYRFSTSTMPRFGLQHGPISARLGLPEVPVTGTPTSPCEVFDTWGFFAAPDRLHDADEYLRQARLLADSVALAGAGLINVYGDPIHIHDQPAFFEAVAAWAEVAQPTTYGDLLDRIGL